jgi:hypothetical protein
MCLASLLPVGGCASGIAESSRVRPSDQLVAEGLRTVATACKLDQAVARRLRFSGRRRGELLAYRLRPVVHEARPAANLFLYNFGTGLVSERPGASRSYGADRASCPTR